MSLFAHSYRSPQLLDPGRPAWLRGVIGGPEPSFSVRVPDTELRQAGHIYPTPSNASHTPEEFRIIKRRVLSHLNASEPGTTQRDPRVVLVTSAAPGEGKTFVSLNLALNLAVEPDLRVTLIDGDLSSKSLSKTLKTGSTPGLTDLLHRGTGVDPGQHGTNVANLNFIPAGESRTEGPELLGGEAMGRLIGSVLAGGSNQIIVIDSRSVLSGSNALTIANHAGQIVFVLAALESARPEVRQALGLLDGAVGPLAGARLGLVLNKTNPSYSAARYANL